MYKYFSLIYKIAFVVSVLLLTPTFVFSQTGQDKEKEGKEPEKGISILLSVYSGRPNPQWWLTEGAEFNRLVGLLKELKTEERILFEYSKWNRLGYASFWIITKNIDGVPYKIHIWRDMANVVQEKRGKAKHAIGALPIYDMLVNQAIKKDQKKFFLNYLKFKAAKEKEKKEKQKK